MKWNLQMAFRRKWYVCFDHYEIFSRYLWFCQEIVVIVQENPNNFRKPHHFEEISFFNRKFLIYMKIIRPILLCITNNLAIPVLELWWQLSKYKYINGEILINCLAQMKLSALRNTAVNHIFLMIWLLQVVYSCKYYVSFTLYIQNSWFLWFCQKIVIFS